MKKQKWLCYICFIGIMGLGLTACNMEKSNVQTQQEKQGIGNQEDEKNEKAIISENVLEGTENQEEKQKKGVEQEQNNQEMGTKKQENEIKTKKLVQKKQEKVELDIKQEKYSISDKEITYTILNHTGKELQIELIPILKKKTKEGWKQVKLIEGFCGVPDLLEEELKGSLSLDWYEDLKAGTYQLTYVVYGEQEEKVYISDTFKLVKAQPNITMTIKEDKITNKTEEITILLKNNSNEEYTYGTYFSLEKKGETWKNVSFLDGVGFHDIAWILEKKSSREETISIKDYFGTLKKGTYRLTKEMYKVNGEKEVVQLVFRID